jgi:PPOX class probable F420-dependent enzyme
MSVVIPESHRDLLQGPLVVTLATVMPDGQPQATAVWCKYDGEHVLMSTVRGRQKEKNMRERPLVAIMAIDSQDPYRYLEVRGKVAEITPEGGLDLINELALLYVNKPKFYGGVAPAELAGKEERVVCKIEPLKVTAFG